MKICTIKDTSTEGWGMPIIVQHVNQAIRSFKEEINNKDSTIGKYPTEFDLYLIGEYNELTGQITPYPPERIARGADYKEQ